jgi:hypothetical protein
MDGITNQALIDLLVASAEDGQWWRLVGIVLVVLVGLVRFLTEKRFSAAVGRWTQAVSGVVRAWAAALMVGGVWWTALLVALFVSASSRTFWAQIRSLLPERKEEEE